MPHPPVSPTARESPEPPVVVAACGCGSSCGCGCQSGGSCQCGGSCCGD